MQYFVSAENSSYFYWQLELLIESFIMHGVEDSLVIGLADNDEQKIRGFSFNLVKHENKFMIPNEGRTMGYLPLNRINAIRYALAYKVLKFPFTIIHADMVLKDPISLSEDDLKYGIVINNMNELPESETTLVKEEVDSFVDTLAEESKVDKKDILRVPFFASPAIFNKDFEQFSDPFFSKVQVHENRLISERGSNFPCERTSWEMALTEVSQYVGVKGKFMCAPMVYDNDEVNFIHYKSGIPPVFHKKYFKYEKETFHASAAGPYETIMEHNPTKNTDYVHKVIKSYVRRNSR